MKLRDVLAGMVAQLDGADTLPDKRKCACADDWYDIRPNSNVMVELCFMCEDETHVCTYPAHPLLIPWYDCEVDGFYPAEENTLKIWLAYENYLQKKLTETHEWKKEATGT